ncbi:MAG: hypothetical protein Q8862_11645 [Bacteroidota bacterium]|nr:hypothetical protein [Bacteroidota bacterium]MDP4207074.1 hypothetical protein [Bacteroidota bacterium]
MEYNPIISHGPVQRLSNKIATPYFVRPLDVVQSWFVRRNDDRTTSKFRIKEGANKALS